MPSKPGKAALPAHLQMRLHRVTDLFKTGRALVLDDTDPNDPVVVYVQKLNSFQRQDALRDAEYGRSRRMAALTEESEEIESIRLRLVDYTDEEMVKSILSPKSGEFWAKGRDDVLADKDWEERVAAIRDHQEAIADGSYIPDDEQERMNTVNAEFIEAITAAMEARNRDAVSDLMAKSRQERENDYILAYRQMRGADAWQDEYNRTELWYALRDCDHRDVKEHEIHDHHSHQHPQLLPERVMIYELPDQLVEQVQAALRELSIPVGEVGNSDAPRSSSVSSERPDTAEASAPSTPAETSTEPAGTSSTPSTPETRSSDG